MINLLPAILIGGPPHAGKSVLFHSLAKALHEREIPHHAVRACPDGDGDWFHEIDRTQADNLRIKGKWNDDFVMRTCVDISRRLLPTLVDMGGQPVDQQIEIVRQCTHTLLLLHDEDEASKTFWLKLTETNGLLPLAQISSKQMGTETIDADESVLHGTLVGLERGTLAHGPLFDLLVERIAALFGSYSLTELERTHLTNAPTELVIHLPSLLQTLSPGAKIWRPQLLPTVLAYIPGDTPLSVYGKAPHWLYSALAVHCGQQAFYQFDPRSPGDETSIGWVTPPPLQISAQTATEIHVQCDTIKDATRLSMEIVKKHLDYAQAAFLPFPPVHTQSGLILNGSMPSWLLTALVRLYVKAGVSWVACYQPQVEGAIVVHSCSNTYAPGDVISLSRS